MGAPPGIDYPRLSAELIRVLRGRRSQMALSRRLGYRTNALYLWEARKGSPTAAGFFVLAERCGVDVRQALSIFYRDPPPWMRQVEVTTSRGAAALLRDLRGNAKLVDLARSLRRSRYALSRWLDASAEPRLPDFLQVIEVTSLRLLDFVACFADPERLSSVRARWRRLQLARRAAYDRPWSHAVLRALELSDYRGLPRHEPGWIARRLGLSLAEETESLRVLSTTGQIELRAGRWVVRGAQSIDTRRDPQAARELKAWWFDVGTERYRRGSEGVFSYNLFGVSHADLERIQALQRAYFREIRSIVASSEPVQAVALVNLQLLSLLDAGAEGSPPGAAAAVPDGVRSGGARAGGDLRANQAGRRATSDRMSRPVVIYHNPRCSKSRQTLALLRERGVEPEIVEYLKAPPDAATVEGLIARLGVEPHALVRSKEAAYSRHGLAPSSSSADVARAIESDPILLERPVVVVGDRAVIGRPPENVLSLLS